MVLKSIFLSLTVFSTFLRTWLLITSLWDDFKIKCCSQEIVVKFLSLDNDRLCINILSKNEIISISVSTLVDHDETTQLLW